MINIISLTLTYNDHRVLVVCKIEQTHHDYLLLLLHSIHNKSLLITGLLSVVNIR